jgi:hypothetical protein
VASRRLISTGWSNREILNIYLVNTLLANKLTYAKCTN